MRLLLSALLLACAPVPAPAPPAEVNWTPGPSLPRPITNNAVAGTSSAVFSFLGLTSNKTWAGITRDAWRLELGPSPSWKSLPPVPGERGRLAATAQTVGGRVYLIGGYTVAPNGKEVSVPSVDIFDPATNHWSAGPPMPLPVDDTVSAVWRGRHIFLVSGWHDNDNVADVQRLDTETGAWTTTTPIPGPPVFGHAGAVVGNTVVYCDGVAKERHFVEVQACYRGDIGDDALAWRRIDNHPGPPRYRMAAAAISNHRVAFAGGSPNPYNYDGVGYDRAPSPATTEVFAYDISDDAWHSLPPLPTARMDHRGLAVTADAIWLVAGMGPEQHVVDTTWRLPR